jgi:hypothetical protein
MAGRVTEYSAIKAGLMASLRAGLGETRGESAAPDNSKNVFTYFRPPFTSTDGIGGVHAATTGAVGVLTFADGNHMSSTVIGDASASAPHISAHARGLIIALDASDTNDGAWLDLGYGLSGSENANSRGAFVIGTDDAFYLRVRLDIGDVSDTARCYVGFVKGGFPDGGLVTSCSDYAVLNVNAGDIYIETRLNGGTASTTDTTQDVLDYGTTGDVYDLEVRVSLAGKVNFLINNAEPTVDVTNFTFDSADTVNAVFSVALAGAGAGDPTVVLHEWESGFLSARGLETISDLSN